DYLAAPNGTITIYGNATGCNSPEEVIEACETVSIEEIVARSDISFFPNPFTDHLTIEFNLPQSSTVTIQIFNAMGAKVAELHHGPLPAGQQQFTWHAGDLPKGMYFYRLQAGGNNAVVKVIKQ
ncbi:MAG: T9SS type A sorting domain-containing protein, partial [Bacteroidales bacterium]